MEFKIPVRSFAVAAEAASKPFKCQPEFVFDGGSHVSSRARTVAIAAMISVFPKAKRITIAQGFNLKIDQLRMSAMVYAARKQPWWCDKYFNSVVDAIKQDYAKNPWAPHIAFDNDGNIEFALDDENASVVKEHEREIVATQYTPRRWTPARIIRVGAARPRTVTAALLGDPPPGRREQLAAMRSQHYMAGNESGRFRYRGKRVLETAE